VIIMTTIRLATADQRLFFLEKPVVATGDVNSVEIHVDFDSIWDNYGKEAVFFTEKKRTPIADALVDGICKIPSEVLSDACFIFIGVRGVHSDGRVKTTTLVKFKLSEGTPSGGSPSKEPELDVYQRLLASYGEMQTNLAEAYENAEKLISQSYDEAKELIAEADEATEGKIAVVKARIDNLIKSDENVFSGYALREREFSATKIHETLLADGSTKYSAGVTIYFGKEFNPEKLYVLSASVHFSDSETVESNALWKSDEKILCEYDRVMDQWRIFLKYESKTKPEKDYVAFRVVYAYSVDIDSAYASLAELNDVRVGTDGKVYPTAGEAVRSQLSCIARDLTWNDLYYKNQDNYFLGEKDVVFTYNKELGLYFAEVFVSVCFEKDDYLYMYVNGEENHGYASENEEGIPYCDTYDLLNGGKPEYDGTAWTDSAIYCTKESGSQFLKWYIYDSTGSTDDTKAFTIALKKKVVRTNPISGFILDDETRTRLLPYVTADDNGKHLEVENGEWVLKKVEATGGSERTVILEEQTMEIVDGYYESTSGLFEATAGETYIVVFDGTEYTCTAILLESGAVVLGNMGALGGENTGEPFVVGAGTGLGTLLICESENSTCTLAIYQEGATNELPTVTVEDEGKFLRVVGGKWTAVEVTNGNEVEY
jgi:hypothetical protein